MKTFKIEDMDEKTMNIYENLKGQVNAVFKNSHECSFKTRETYKERMDMFAKFLAVEYRKQNIKKISNEHLTHYAKYLQEVGLSTSYVTTSMSAIRYFYKKAVGERFKIKSNKALGVNCRAKEERIGRNRAINDQDYAVLLAKTRSDDLKEYEYGVKLGMILGVRIHEFYRIRVSQIKKTLKLGLIEIKGKGGFVRTNPVGAEAKALLIEVLKDNASDNDRVFVMKNEKTHEKIKTFEDYIRNTRDEFGNEYTYHSLRHRYAQKLYAELKSRGVSEYEARMIVSRRLGHNRVDISATYLDETTTE
ncbi:MAG: tyrosine-type recombinase/integrase [Clostridiales bacterium]|nr:tyrosine-type recombinase/integrase [Clostridiales bacterium]